MIATLSVRNISSIKRLVRQDALERLAERICAGEKMGDDYVQISLLLCDDAYMSNLNEHYRKMRGPTDVLSFEQDGPCGSGESVLGDVVISLETAARACMGDRKLLRREVDVLFCHGLLHLLGYDHGTSSEEAAMKAKQAEYLNVSEFLAWPMLGSGDDVTGVRAELARR